MGNSRSTTLPLNFRLALVLTGLAIIVTGLAVHFVVTGVTGDFLGGALYAGLVCAGVAFVRPRQNALTVALIGFAVCSLLELFQLTGVPLAIAEVFAPAALLLGTTFVPLDFVAYLVGAACTAAGIALSRTDRAVRAAESPRITSTSSTPSTSSTLV